MTTALAAALDAFYLELNGGARATAPGRHARAVCCAGAGPSVQLDSRQPSSAEMPMRVISP